MVFAMLEHVHDLVHVSFHREHHFDMLVAGIEKFEQFEIGQGS